MSATMVVQVRVRRLLPVRLWLGFAAWSVGLCGRPQAPFVVRVGNLLFRLARVQTKAQGGRQWHSQPFPARLRAEQDGTLTEVEQ